MHIWLTSPYKPPLEYVNQVIQLADAKICMGMFTQMSISFINQQDCCSACHMAGRHIINAITDLRTYVSFPLGLSIYR